MKNSKPNLTFFFASWRVSFFYLAKRKETKEKATPHSGLRLPSAAR